MLLQSKKAIELERNLVNLKLIRFACISDTADYNDVQVEQLILLLNQLPNYSHIHWRLFPLIKNKALQLGILNKLDSKVNQLIREKTSFGIIFNRAQQSLLQKVLNFFSKNDIQAILLKGTAFNQSIYEPNIPRLSGDIDILVQIKDIERAKALLADFMQYKPKRKNRAFDDLYELTLVSNCKLRLEVDLHTNIANPLLLDISEEVLWSNSTPLSVGFPDNISKLSNELAIIHLAIHSFKNLDFGTYGLIDAHELIINGDVELPYLIKLAEDLGLSFLLFYFLKELNLVMETQVNLQQLFPGNYYYIKYRVCKRFLKTSDAILGIFSLECFRWKQLLFQLSFIEDKIRIVRTQWIYLKQRFVGV